MEVVVRGYPQKEFKRADIPKAAHFYSDLLMKRRLHERCSVEIHLIKNLYDKEFVMAAMMGDFDPHLGAYRDFDLWIDDNLTYNQTLTSLAHEMTHVKQWASGEYYMYDKGDDKHRWHGKVYDLSQKMNRSANVTKEYLLLPWEIEARGYEGALYDLFKEHKKSLKKKK